jgi:Periplasmic copper-binding protein (NosD)
MLGMATIDLSNYLKSNPSVDSAFSAALLALASAGGGTLYVPSGRYNIATAIAIPDNVKVIGDGTGSTVVVPTTGGQDVFQILRPNGPAASCIELTALAIDASNAPNACGVRATLSCYNHFHDISFIGAATNVFIDRGIGNKITNIVSRSGVNAAGKPVPSGTATFTSLGNPNNANGYLAKGFDLIIDNYAVENLPFAGVTDPAILLNYTVRATISSFVSNDLSEGPPNANGIVVQNCEGIRVFGGIITNAQTGIVVDGVNGLSIIGQDIDTPQGYAAIHLVSGRFIKIEGCHISGNGEVAGAPSPHGVVVEDAAMDVVVSSNTFWSLNTGSNGILIGAGVSGVQVEGNFIGSMGTGIGIVNGTAQYLTIVNNHFRTCAAPIVPASPANATVTYANNRNIP